ncbi:DUF4492 domain-containing protein [Nitratifractor sp.]
MSKLAINSISSSIRDIAYRVWSFYRDGFRRMRLGRKLWLLVAIKLFVLFVVIKWLFFPDVMQEHFSNDTQRSDYILRQLTKEQP